MYQLPEKIKLRKESQGDVHIYYVRHEEIGDLGRIVLSEYMGQSHFSSEVCGNPNDPLTQKRLEIFKPIAEDLIEEVSKQLKSPSQDIPLGSYKPEAKSSEHFVESQLLCCIKCNTPVCRIVYTHKNTQADIEDYYRLVFKEFKKFDILTYIVGLVDTYTEQVLVLKAYPQRDEKPEKIDANIFDVKVQNMQSGHCGV